jgi:predicted nuclease with TOPRIM domain
MCLSGLDHSRCEREFEAIRADCNAFRKKLEKLRHEWVALEDRYDAVACELSDLKARNVLGTPVSLKSVYFTMR